MFSSRSAKDRILSAASTVIIRNGTAGARMQEIAEHAGVSTAALHYHFGSKEELADRVLEVVLVRLIGRFLNAWNPGDTLAANVQRAGQVCMTEFAEDSRTVGYILAEIHRNPDRLERVRQRLPASISYRSHELLRHLGARNQPSTDTNPCARPEELLVDLVGLCAFPFLARPLLPVLLGPEHGDWESVLSAREEVVRNLLLACAERESSEPGPAGRPHLPLTR